MLSNTEKQLRNSRMTLVFSKYNPLIVCGIIMSTLYYFVPGFNGFFFSVAWFFMAVFTALRMRKEIKLIMRSNK